MANLPLVLLKEGHLQVKGKGKHEEGSKASVKDLTRNLPLTEESSESLMQQGR
jgi:hypothetical protein